MKNSKQILTMGLIAAGIASASLAANVNAAHTEPTTDINIQAHYDDFDFSTEKKYTIADLQEELNLVKNTELQKQLVPQITNLDSATDEDTFFKQVEPIYEALDNYYEENNIEFHDEDFEEYEFNLLEDKPEIIAELKEEISKYVTDENLKASLTTPITNLEKISDEEQFFDALDKIYQTLDTHYENNGIQVEFDDEFEENNYEFKGFDFASEKAEILSELQVEIAEEENKALKTVLSEAYEAVKNIDNETTFFDTLETYEDKYDDVLDTVQE